MSLNNSNQNDTFTNTAKLPIDVVKRLIAAVSLRPNLWLRNSNGNKRCDVTQLWFQVSEEVQLPADICRIKWGHLRDNFRKVFIRNTYSDETPTSWRFYNDMRFMEKSVAENIVRQNRNKHPNRFWPNMRRDDIVKADSNILERANFYSALYNHSMESSNIEEAQTKFKINSSTNEEMIKKSTSKCPNSDKFKHSELFLSNQYQYNNQDCNDDDFDEDAATDDNDDEVKVCSLDKKRKIDDIFTIEVFDDEGHEDNDIQNIPRKNYLNIATEQEHVPFSSEKTLDMFPCMDIYEQNADRMFLLSLLPYLQKVDPQHKLHVRQKLQTVLIEELDS